MHTKKRKMLYIFLLPVLLIVLIQGAVPLLMLWGSNLQGKLENNAVQMVQHTVENRQVVLENEMIEHWSNVYKEGDALNRSLENVFAQENVDMQGFLQSKEIQKLYLEQIFGKMVDTLQYNTTSGLFVVLANDSPVTEAAKYSGFFIRDSDPQSSTATDTDLLLERGSKSLAQTHAISLDSPWTTEFSLAGSGNRQADDFFYKPYEMALAHMDTDMKNLGYWSKVFVLEDNSVDNHKMITYSYPLVYKGTVYGVLGVELALNYLTSYFSVQDLDQNLNAGYALLVKNGDDQYEAIAGKGALYEAATRGGDTITLTRQDKHGRHDMLKVDQAKVGEQEVYGCMAPLTLYSNNVPYEDTEWVLCGLVTEYSIYGLARSIFLKMVVAIVCGLLLAVIMVYVLVQHVTRPVYRLVESVRGGVEGIHSFKMSAIQEIDELHDVVEKLTDAQRTTQEQLMEEKERYRIAVESSQDMFFTFRQKDRILEVVNSGYCDGLWDCRKHPEYLMEDRIYPADRERLYRYLKRVGKKLDFDFRMKYRDSEDYIWVNLSGSMIRDTEEEDGKIVGCIHDIHQRKLLEREQRKKQFYDPATGLYRLQYGLEAIRTGTGKYTSGMLFLAGIGNFTTINDTYGLMFGDLLLDQLAQISENACRLAGPGIVTGIRAGASELLFWMPETDEEHMLQAVKKIRSEFGALVNEKYLQLDVICGLAGWDDHMGAKEGVSHVKSAFLAAKQRYEKTAVYEGLSETEKHAGENMVFGEVVSLGRAKQVTLTSLAINMFDRGGAFTAILDLLVLKIREKYSLTDLVITHFGREFLVNSLEYRWKETGNGNEEIVHCTESQYQQFTECKEMQEIHPVCQTVQADPVCGRFIADSAGIVFHMMDQGEYSGSIFFMGIDGQILQTESEKKLFNELASVIQNRLNLQHHDISARAKSDFLARMSHEIRTPMNGIIGMTEIALKEGQTPEKRTDCLQKIRSSSNYLLGLLNDILDMSKIESGKMHLVQEEYDLYAMTEELGTILETRIREKQLQFIREIHLMHHWFVCDELRLSQVLVNLLSNAVKYTEPGGHVTLTVTETVVTKGVSDLYFAVKDDGIGIPKEKQQLIFGSFEQADDSEKARKQGTGLGLAISSRLVHMMDAEIYLESEPGKGSVFSFCIRLKTAEERTEVEKPTEELAVLQGKRVLVAEDNTLNMEIIRTLLEDRGMTVTEATDGKQAVETFRASSEGYYDLILMDIMMPKMDGLEAAGQIRRLNRADAGTVPIVAMSANAFEEDVKTSLASGMNAHLSKPVDIQKLDQTLVRVLTEK